MENSTDSSIRHGDAGSEARSPEARSFKLQRTTSRKLAMQLLYALDLKDAWKSFAEEPLDEIFAVIEQETEEIPPHAILRKSWSRARKLCLGIAANLSAIDEMIAQAARNWTLSRINCVDRNLLRLAIYEMKFAEQKVAPPIVINDAVELAHLFGQKDSWRFVNGVLDQVRKTIQETPFTLNGTQE